MQFGKKIDVPPDEIGRVLGAWLRPPEKLEKALDLCREFPHKARLGEHSSLFHVRPLEHEILRALRSATYHLVDGETILSAEKIGEGQYSNAFKCERNSGDFVVAKLLVQAQPDTLFEWLALSQLPPHDNLLRSLGVCTSFPCKRLKIDVEGAESYVDGSKREDGHVALITLYMANGSVEHYLDKHGSASAELQRQWLLEVAAGLNHLHTYGVVHRDLATRNIFLGDKLRAIVADFGLSRTAPPEGQAYTFTKNYPFAAAPGPTYSSASDIFSIGVTFLDVASCGDFEKKVAEAEGVEHLDAKVIDEYLAKLPSIPADLIKRCLSFDPAKRPTAQDIIVELSNPAPVPTPRVRCVLFVR